MKFDQLKKYNVRNSAGSIGILWVFCDYFVKRSYSDWKKNSLIPKK